MKYLKETNLVVHSNSFASAIDKKITIVEQRMLAIYLSKLNPGNEDTREVSFHLEDYEKIMGLQRFNITQLKECAKKIIMIPVIIDDPDGGFTACPLFSTFGIKKIDGEWMVIIKCSDDVMPYLFDLKKEFMKYELWNILNLTEKNHQQMYRILKQYETIGAKTIVLKTLKFCLGVDDKYEKFYDFRRDVLEPCKKALKESTDICFEYDPIRKGRRIYEIKFSIHKNKPIGNKKLIAELVHSLNQSQGDQDNNSSVEIEEFQTTNMIYQNEEMRFFGSACDDEFSEEEVNVLFDMIVERMPQIKENHNNDLERYHYLQKKYHEMNRRKPSRSRFGYLVALLRADLEVK